MEKINFTDEERKNFQRGIQKFIETTMQIESLNDKSTDGAKQTNDELNQALNRINYCYKLSYGESKLTGSGNSKKPKRTSIPFCPLHTTVKGNINFPRIGLNHGLYIYFAYHYQEKKYSLEITYSWEKGEEGASCSAFYSMKDLGLFDDQNTNFHFTYDDFEANKEKITDDFLKLVNIFNSYKIDDFRGQTMIFEGEEKQNKQDDHKSNHQKNQPLNQILYGPPGTGKTYHTINKALEIISQEDQSIDEELREEIKDILKNLKSDFPTPENRKRAKKNLMTLKDKLNL